MNARHTTHSAASFPRRSPVNEGLCEHLSRAMGFRDRRNLPDPMGPLHPVVRFDLRNRGNHPHWDRITHLTGKTMRDDGVDMVRLSGRVHATAASPEWAAILRVPVPREGAVARTPGRSGRQRARPTVSAGNGVVV